MRYPKLAGLATAASMAFMALLVVGTASATTLEVGGVAQNKAVSFTASLKSGTSLLVKDESGTSTDTCTGSTIAGSTTTFTGTPGGPVSGLTFTSCSHTTTVLAKGSISFAWTSGTHATVSSSGAEITVQSTFFGASAVCKTGPGRTIGTLTGVGSGSATLDLNAKITCGVLSDVSWTGTYTITSPAGLGAVS
jgi:hypothetical protein